MPWVRAAGLAVENFEARSDQRRQSFARRGEHPRQATRNAKAANHLPFARHHDFAPMTSPTRVASPLNRSKAKFGPRVKVDYRNHCMSSKIPL
jgi:hypothetical protein